MGFLCCYLTGGHHGSYLSRMVDLGPSLNYSILIGNFSLPPSLKCACKAFNDHGRF